VSVVVEREPRKRKEDAMSNQKNPVKFKGTENKERYHAMLGKRFSNAAGPHDPRPNRQRTRATAKSNASADYR
jgi:hypothetical protein